MKSYPIWIDVTSCLYKSSKSYGARDVNIEEVSVGTSSRYSYHMSQRKLTRRSFESYNEYTDVTVFREHFNGICIKEIILDNKTKKPIEETTAEIKGL